LATYSYYPFLGNATLEPSIAQTITLGDFVIGSVNNATFVISSRSLGQPSAVVSEVVRSRLSFLISQPLHPTKISSGGIFAVADKILSTNSSQHFTSTIPDIVILLGNWYVGDLNGE